MIGDLRYRGFHVIPEAISKEDCDTLKNACYEAQNAFRGEIESDRTKRAGEVGVIRAPMKYREEFFSLMCREPINTIVDQELGPHSILHLQNIFMLPPDNGGNVFQTTFHRDFPRHAEGFRCSLNVFVAITDFTEKNGALRVVPGSHQNPAKPDPAYLAAYSEPVVCPKGSLIVFDSTLWHASGMNLSREDRIGVNHQFTHHWIKPQLDYCRILGEEVILSQPRKVQQYLGWHSRVPGSLDEYYRPEAERVYRKGQG